MTLQRDTSFFFCVDSKQNYLFSDCSQKIANPNSGQTNRDHLSTKSRIKQTKKKRRWQIRFVEPTRIFPRRIPTLRHIKCRESKEICHIWGTHEENKQTWDGSKSFDTEYHGGLPTCRMVRRMWSNGMREIELGV